VTSHLPIVANTRDEASDGPLARALKDVGLDSMHCPTIAIAPPDDPRPFVGALGTLARFDWIAFTSAHAVDATCRRPEWQRAFGLGILPRIAAVGDASARRLASYGLTTDAVPETPGAGALAEAIGRAAGTLKGARVLWPRGDLAQPALGQALARAGALVTAPIAYRTLPVQPESLAPFIHALSTKRLAAIAFCSPSSARHLARGLALRDLSSLAGRLLVGSIGPTTSAALHELGLDADVQAAEASASGLAVVIAARLGAAAGGRP
jgi:uroporphyrinogen-III synthase